MIPQYKREVSGLDHQVDQNYHQPLVASTSHLTRGHGSCFHTIFDVFATPSFYLLSLKIWHGSVRRSECVVVLAERVRDIDATLIWVDLGSCHDLRHIRYSPGEYHRL